MLPTFEAWMAGRTARWTDLLAMARRAEAVGFDSLWLLDHVLYEFGDPPQPPHGLGECWSFLAAMPRSSATSRPGPRAAAAPPGR